LVHWPSLTFRKKFYGDRPRGTHPSGVKIKCKRGSQNIAILDLSKAISRKRCKIGGKYLLFITNIVASELSIATKIGDLE